MTPDLILGFGVAAIIAIILVVVLTRPKGKRDVHSLYSEGLDHLLRGNLKNAYRCFKGVIEQDTDHISAYLKMGQTLRQANALEKALSLHESLLARPSLSSYDRLDLYKNLALDYHALGNNGKAIEWARAILKIERRNLWALRNLVKFYRDSGDWESCGKFLGQWQKATGKEDTRMQALCRFRQGYDLRESSDLETVRGHYEQALKIDSSFAPAHYYLAESYADEARNRRSELRARGNGSPKDSRAGEEGWDNACADAYTQAVSHWTVFVELSPQDTYRILPSVEEALFYLQRFDELEVFLSQVLDKEPGNPYVIAALADFYVRKGALDEAEDVLAKLPDKVQPAALVQAIRLKLRYRRDASENLMPALDKLVDSLQLAVSSGTAPPISTKSLLSWLEPSGDPLAELV